MKLCGQLQLAGLHRRPTGASAEEKMRWPLEVVQVWKELKFRTA